MQIDYIDTAFVKDKSHEYRLSIRYATDGLSFCIHDGSNRMLAFCHRPLDCRTEEERTGTAVSLLSREELLQPAYGEVHFLYCCPEKVLIPAPLFRKETLPRFYRTCHPCREQETLVYREVRPAEAFLAAPLPTELTSFLRDRYPSVRIAESAWAFLSLSLSGILLNIPHLFLEIHPGYFDLLITEGNRIILFNTFGHECVDDIIYHSLNAVGQSGTDRSRMQSRISGQGMDVPEQASLLLHYLPNASVSDFPPLAGLVGTALNHSSFITLLNIHKCA